VTEIVRHGLAFSGPTSLRGEDPELAQVWAPLSTSLEPDDWCEKCERCADACVCDAPSGEDA